MPVELRGADLEEALNAFLGAGVLPPSRPNTTVKNLETSVLLLPPSESGLLASKIFSHLLRVETRLRIAYQFSPAFHNWLVRQVQPVIGDAIIDSVCRWIGPADTAKRKTFLLRMAVMLAPDLPLDKVDEEVRQEAESTFDSPLP